MEQGRLFSICLQSGVMSIPSGTFLPLKSRWNYFNSPMVALISFMRMHITSTFLTLCIVQFLLLNPPPPPPPPAHPRGFAIFFFNWCSIPHPHGMQKETIPHPQESWHQLKIISSFKKDLLSYKKLKQNEKHLQPSNINVFWCFNNY